MFRFLKKLYRTIILFLKVSIYILILIYKIIAYIFRILRFLFTNKHTSVPSILLLISIIFKMSIQFISNIYFIYLVHCFALSKGLYKFIVKNINLSISNLKENLKTKKLLNLISSEKIVLSNFLLDDDEKTLNIHHLAITPSGLYNIVPLCSYSDSKNDFDNTKAIYTIYNETETLKATFDNLLDLSVPLKTLVLIPDNININSIYNDSFEIIYNHQLPYIINSNTTIKSSIDINSIKDIIYENKAWLIDILVIKFINFLSKYKKIIILSIICPFIYFIYIFLVTYISNEIYILFSDLIKYIMNIF